MNGNMTLPSRPAPSLEDVCKNKKTPNAGIFHPVKKKPPPRPPPPNFNKLKSKSVWNLNNKLGSSLSLIDLTPESPNWKNVLNNGTYSRGSVCSSFSSSTSSLASSKKSFESESIDYEQWALNNPGKHQLTSNCSAFYINTRDAHQLNVESAPTIIRVNVIRNKQIQELRTEGLSQRERSPPMPNIPPPSPPKKQYAEVSVPYGIALYDYEGVHQDDLKFKTNDIIFLLRRVNSEWLYGKVEDHEGLCPNNYISIQVPLPEDEKLVFALYEFIPQAAGDLALKPGQSVLVTGRVSEDWLMGKSNGHHGQFPAKFVDRIPSTM